MEVLLDEAERVTILRRAELMRDRMKKLAQKANAKRDHAQGAAYFCAKACYERLVTCLEAPMADAEKFESTVPTEGNPIAIIAVTDASGRASWKLVRRRYDPIIHAAVKGCFRAYIEEEYLEHFCRKSEIEEEAREAERDPLDVRDHPEIVAGERKHDLWHAFLTLAERKPVRSKS